MKAASNLYLLHKFLPGLYGINQFVFVKYRPKQHHGPQKFALNREIVNDQ